MRVCNIIFKDFDQLRRELIAHNVQKVSKEQFFVQIFMGVADKNIAKELLDFFDTALDCRVLLVQSGRETIVSGNIFSSQILISISCFSHSTLKRAYYPADRDIDEIARDIRENLASEKTKLLVVFIACGSFYHQDLLGAIKKELPSLLLCGGRSHPYDMGTMQGLIGDNDGIYDHGMICLSIDSEILSVQSDFVFGWEDIGLPLKITKSQHNIVYEINHKKAIEVFEHYLGKTALENLHATTYIFPLIYRVNGVPIARVAMKICQDGSVVFNDNIPEGTEVKFGFGLMENISRNTELAYAKIPKNVEGIYMYSCIGHLMFSGKEGMESILKIFRDEPALCGFFTFGEIYSCRDQNVFLGLTNTFYCLCEGDFEESQKPSLQKARANLDKGTLVMSTLANLMHRVNQEVMEVTKNFETYYEFVDELMFHIIADAELNILYSNKRISQVSLYDFSQVQGKNCLEFVDAQTREEITHRILPILAEKGQWSGKIYQYRKDGTPYYVKMIIKAIKDREGNVMRYIIGQMDDTADELKRMALESESIFLKRSDEERRYLLDQYQSILDKNQSFFRLDLNRNFIYGNEIFLKITGLKLEEILGKNIYDFIPVNEQRQFDKISKDLVEKGYYEGVLEYTRKDGKKVYIQSAAYFIKDLNDIPFEIIAVGVEITQIIEGVKEIESIQKDVIYSMGAICEGKSRETGNHIIRVAEKGQWSGKIYQYRKDGTPYYVKMIIKAIKDREGNVMRYIIGQMDDTADELKRMALESESIFLKRSDEERRYLLDQYQSILDKNQSFFRLDLNRNFIYGNEIFLKITGLKLEEILGKNIYDFIPVNEQRQFDKISKDLVEKGYYEGVLEYTRKDGKKVYIQSAAYFIKDLNDIPFEIIAVGVEITQIIEGVKEIESIQKDVIYSMGAICEGKSRETGNHIIRVAEYSALLAELCGCSKEDQELLRIASPMHDIGKVGISDAILNKSGKLTPEEFEIMKTHTTIGEEIFKNSNRLILRAAGEIAGSHHEWWNGEGYPRGIQGEEIPLFGRITALADVFDALSNDRCYKKAWPLPKVLEYVKSLRGKQFQPELLDLFLENLDRFLEIGKKYQDKNSSSLFAQKEESCGGGGTKHSSRSNHRLSNSAIKNQLQPLCGMVSISDWQRISVEE
ncbi:putative signaling protein [Helicobacter mustelae 12198]|uniref:Putative signaling protein n=1 Tax=Helicobacter mustelae (strain ATCC 43772 / CCUG 25715 / CIP 103759 / LMG 18044 / NCTC 12198 / R85-136P) TaxID=679897 RepID=D3UGA2_HELM1|nr:PAS domain-containing protein [Helicobacter mustelae]CBG39523.1 putative signaling protein [Helicobacter mustelae 12198]